MAGLSKKKLYTYGLSIRTYVDIFWTLFSFSNDGNRSKFTVYSSHTHISLKTKYTSKPHLKKATDIKLGKIYGEKIALQK